MRHISRSSAIFVVGSAAAVTVAFRIYSTTSRFNLNYDDTLWVPEGFAHGFQSLEDGTRVHYKVTNYWDKKSEKSVNPLDTSLRIEWPIQDTKLSEKDLQAPVLEY